MHFIVYLKNYNEIYDNMISGKSTQVSPVVSINHDRLANNRKVHASFSHIQIQAKLVELGQVSGIHALG